MKVAVAGEALIDFTSVGDLRFRGYVGGSPLNTAVAVARLGAPTGFVTQLSTDLFGVRIRRHVETNGIDTRFVLSHDAPSTLAFVERTGGRERYQFLANGAADTLYGPEPLPTLPAECQFLHFGSVSLLSEPAATSFTRLVAAHRDRLTIVFDPNVRPSLIADAGAYRARCAEWIRMSHVLRLSDDDLAYLAADDEEGRAIARWLAEGPSAIIVSEGAGGATLYRRDAERLTVPAFDVEIVDTIGAGDTFTGAVTVALLERDAATPDAIPGLPDSEWQSVLEFAAAAAAVNCTRAGADPPTRDEVDAFRR